MISRSVVVVVLIAFAVLGFILWETKEKLKMGEVRNTVMFSFLFGAAAVFATLLLRFVSGSLTFMDLYLVHALSAAVSLFVAFAMFTTACVLLARVWLTIERWFEHAEAIRRDEEYDASLASVKGSQGE